MDTKNIEKELFNLEKKYWQAMKDQDAKTMLDLTDDPCLIAGAQGVTSIGKEAFASMLESTNYTLNNFELKENSIRVLNNDTAVLAYKVWEDLTVDGEPVSFEAADASTWIRRHGKWVCALHTEAISGDPFGRDRVVSGTFN